MTRIHLSKIFYSRANDTSNAEPDIPAESLCGGDGYTARRGAGTGLIPPRAICSETHCPECVKVLRAKRETGEA